MKRAGDQAKLFDVRQELPNGFLYRPDFLTEVEEEALVSAFETLPLEHAEGYGDKKVKRRIISFGWGYDYEQERLIPGPPLPPFLESLARRIAKWADIPAASVVEALVTEYQPGTALGWHRDNKSFECIFGVSLSGWCRMRLRPLKGRGDPKKVVSLELEPRSIYVMRDEVRWQWQHSVAETRTLRYSITFRTLPARK